MAKTNFTYFEVPELLFFWLVGWLGGHPHPNPGGGHPHATPGAPPTPPQEAPMLEEEAHRHETRAEQ